MPNKRFYCRLVGTIIAPTPLVAVNFIIPGKIINQLGLQFSRLTPKKYAILFCSLDIVCLIAQAIGGAAAALAVNQGTSATMGGNIMLGGIVAQLFSLTIYVASAAECFLRFKYNAPVRHVRWHVDKVEKGQRNVNKNLENMLVGLCYCTLFISIWSVYRTIELANGWSGPIISTEHYFDWLDGCIVALAIYTLNFIHPGVLLKIDDPTAAYTSDEFEEASDAPKGV